MFTKFWADTRGNIAMTFGLMIVPIVGFAGVAMDYGRSTLTRVSMQSALDASALMLSGDIQANPAMTEAAVQARGRQYFDTQFKSRYARDITLNTVYTPATGAPGSLYKIAVSASVNVDNIMAKLVGPETATVGARAEIVWGIKRLELALALDNTGSMASSNKMRELKTATRTLLDTLHKSARKAGDVKIAIIPFATDVNVGPANRDATWLDWSRWDSDNRQCTQWTLGICTATGPQSHDVWNGCVWDRQQNYDTDDTAPTSLSTRFQPHQAGNCPAEMLGLTDIYINNAWVASDLNNTTSPTSVFGQKVNSMTPVGNTNVTIGMAWGWHAVTKSEPLTQADVPAEDLDKVVILLTDGDNTANRWSGSQSAIDARTTLACTNAKNAGIRVYAIRVIDGNANLLRNCATNPGMFYDVQSASELNVVFLSIAQNLANLRIFK